MRRMLLFVILLPACASATRTIPKEWMAGPIASAIENVSLDEKGNVHTATAKPASPIRVEGNRLFNGDKPLTEAFVAIDSFDYSASRGEVVFSAKRKDNFDIGLVSSDGSPINWIPQADPADEIGVQWAPRGNKVSYIVRAKGGDVVRTVHIPTSMQLSTDFPNATIRWLAWDPQAERYAVVYSTPTSSDEVEVMKYDGSARRVATPPSSTLDVEQESFAKDAIVLRPRDLLYSEKIPVVVWIAGDFAWSEPRATLLKNARVAVIVTTRNPDEALWKRVAETPWLDARRIYIVSTASRQPPAANHQLITSDPTLGPNLYRISGNTIAVSPSVIQSFAAGYIADHVRSRR